ncbi:MAG: hypothetical protein ACE5MI_04285 [Acidimicrobiia bacterium]
MDRIRNQYKSLTSTGVDRTLRGLRTGDTGILLTGAALILFRLYMRQRRTRSRIYTTRLSPGEGLHIRARRVQSS